MDAISDPGLPRSLGTPRPLSIHWYLGTHTSGHVYPDIRLCTDFGVYLDITSCPNIWVHRGCNSCVCMVVVACITQVTKLFDKKHILVKNSLCMAMYTDESVTERIRPNPDLCKFITGAELAALAKEAGLARLLGFAVAPHLLEAYSQTQLTLQLCLSNLPLARLVGKAKASSPTSRRGPSWTSFRLRWRSCGHSLRNR